MTFFFCFFLHVRCFAERLIESVVKSGSNSPSGPKLMKVGRQSGLVQGRLATL